MKKWFLILGLLFCVRPAHASTAPQVVAGCVANAATNCTWSNLSGRSASVGDLLYYYAFRTATTAPTAPGSTTNLDTASASTSSFRSGCAVLTSTTPAAVTAANATRIVVAIIHGTPATATANCVTLGIGYHTTAGTSGTTSTYTFTGGQLTVADGSSLIVGMVGSSAAPCTPASLTNNATLSSTDIFYNDTNGGVSSFATTTCSGTTGNWKTDVVEFLATCTNIICETQNVSAGGTCASTSPCTLTVTSTCSGCIGVLWESNNSSTNFISTVTGAGSWSVPAGCQSGNNTLVEAESCAYNLSESAGTTSIVITMASGPSQNAIVYYEFNISSGTPSLDTSGTAARTSFSTTQAGPTLTLSGTNDLIVQENVSGTGNATAITAPYGYLNSDEAKMGTAAATNTASGTAPNWTMPGSDSTLVGALAIQITPAGGTPGCKNGLLLMGAGC